MTSRYRSPAGTALLVQSCVMTITGTALLVVPDVIDLLFLSTTRSAVYHLRAFGYIVGSLFIYVAALLCAVPQPSASACRSVAAGAAVAAALCTRLYVTPLQNATLNWDVFRWVVAYFGCVSVGMFALAPRTDAATSSALAGTPGPASTGVHQSAKLASSSGSLKSSKKRHD